MWTSTGTLSFMIISMPSFMNLTNLLHLVLRDIEYEFVMHLHYHFGFIFFRRSLTDIIAAFIISAADPCMGVFTAVLSAKDLSLISGL